MDGYLARIDPGIRVNHSLRGEEKAWLQMVRGSGELNGSSLHEGDGAAISEESHLTFQALAESDILLFQTT